MSKTFRNRHLVPKNLKIRDGKPWSAFDANNNEYYFGSHSHTQIFYRIFSANLWMFGPIGPSVLETWKGKYFQNKKYKSERRYITSFRRGRYYQAQKEHRHFLEKKYRAKIRTEIRQEEWEKITRNKKACSWYT